MRGFLAVCRGVRGIERLIGRERKGKHLMTVAAAIIIATGMICSTLLALVLLAGHEIRRLVRDILDQVKVAGRKVSVNVDKKINVLVDEDAP